MILTINFEINQMKQMFNECRNYNFVSEEKMKFLIIQIIEVLI